MRRRSLCLLLLGWLLLLPVGSALAQDGGEVHLALGNPSGAKHDSSHHDNYLMVKEYFALSYNDKKGTPNWVSYRLRKSDMGKAPRPDAFHPDSELPRSFH